MSGSPPHGCGHVTHVITSNLKSNVLNHPLLFLNSMLLGFMLLGFHHREKPSSNSSNLTGHLLPDTERLLTKAGLVFPRHFLKQDVARPPRAFSEEAAGRCSPPKVDVNSSWVTFHRTISSRMWFWVFRTDTFNGVFLCRPPFWRGLLERGQRSA